MIVPGCVRRDLLRLAWRLLPNDLPPKSTAFRWFATWRDNGLFETINHHLVVADRDCAGREASPTAVVLDSQSVKTTESGGPSGYDAGKKVKGRKRQVMVDTDGRGLIFEPHPAEASRPASQTGTQASSARQRAGSRRHPDRPAPVASVSRS